MFRVSLYIMACSGRNRLRRWVRRLREPRYLVGVVVGSAYLYFSVFGRMRASRAVGRRGFRTAAIAFLPALNGSGPMMGGLLLLAGAALSLPMPFGSGLLDFSRAEREFLFPSPVSRPQLLVYRLMRSQWAVLFSALVIALTYPLASPGTRLRGFVGAWLALMTCHVFFTGVTLTRTRPAVASWRARAVAWGPRLAVGAAVVVVIVSARRTMLAQSLPLNTAVEAFRLLAITCASGFPRIVLWPFVAVLQPLFATSFATFAAALPSALGVYAATLLWVLSADEAFDAVTDGVAEEREPRPLKRAVSYRARRMIWTLGLEGRPETAFVWKTATQTLRLVGRRFLLRAMVLVAWLTVGVILLEDRAQGLAQVIGLLAAFCAAFAVLLGPQIVRLDLRQDLHHLELLKTWPIRAAAVVRGQMLWPSVLITTIAWTFGAVAMALSATAFSTAGLALRVSAGMAAMIVAPAIVLAQYTVHNAAALIFPAWIVTGGARPRGVDAMGQRLIMLGGTWLMLVLAVTPGAILGGLLWLAFYRFVGPWILIPAGVLAALIVVVEVLMATEALGPAYDRLDITSVERGET